MGHAPNVSVSQGVKGIMGIINSFLFVFSTRVKVSDIPETYKKYFLELSDFHSDDLIHRDIVCKAMIRKLQDEVYFQVKLTDAELKQAKIGGLTGFDIKLPMAIDRSRLNLVTDDNHKVLSAYDVAQFVYEKTKDVAVFRTMHDDFFYMFDHKEAFTTMNAPTAAVGKRCR